MGTYSVQIMPQAAERLMLKIEETIVNLGDAPYRYPYCRDETLRQKGYRRAIVGKYLVFYLVNEERKSVLVMRVMYGGRNLAALF